MDNWNVEGNKVQHVLSEWIGFVVEGHDEKPSAVTVRFWNSEKGEFVIINCVKAELRDPIY